MRHPVVFQWCKSTTDWKPLACMRGLLVRASSLKATMTRIASGFPWSLQFSVAASSLDWLWSTCIAENMLAMEASKAKEIESWLVRCVMLMNTFYYLQTYARPCQSGNTYSIWKPYILWPWRCLGDSSGKGLHSLRHVNGEFLSSLNLNLLELKQLVGFFLLRLFSNKI